MKKLPFRYRIIRSALAGRFVLEHYRHDLVKAKFPEISHIVAGPELRSCCDLFKASVAYARKVNNDPDLSRNGRNPERHDL